MRSKFEASELVLCYVKRFKKQSRYTVTAVYAYSGAEFSRASTSRTDDGVIARQVPLIRWNVVDSPSGHTKQL